MKFSCRFISTGTHTQARQLLSFSQVNIRSHDGCMNPPPQDTSSTPRLLRRGRIQSHPRGTTYSAGSWRVRRWRSTRGRNAVPPEGAADFPRIFRGFSADFPRIFRGSPADFPRIFRGSPAGPPRIFRASPADFWRFPGCLRKFPYGGPGASRNRWRAPWGSPTAGI